MLVVGDDEQGLLPALAVDHSRIDRLKESLSLADVVGRVLIRRRALDCRERWLDERVSRQRAFLGLGEKIADSEEMAVRHDPELGEMEPGQ